MSGKRTKALRREFKRVFGKPPVTELRVIGPQIVGNQFRMFKRAVQRAAR